MKIDVDEFFWQLDKEMTFAREEGKNHAYIKGLRDAGELAKSMGEEEKTEPIQLKEPLCCKECNGIAPIFNVNNETTWYCHMSAILPENPEQDISTIYVNPDQKPSWCPIAKMNKTIKTLSPEKAEKVNMMIKGLSAFFGSEDLLNRVK